MVPVPQPVKAVIAMRRRTLTSLAAELGVSHHHLGRVVNGYVSPSDRIRQGLAEALNAPQELLFRAADEEAPL